MTWYNYKFIAYFDYMFSIVGLALCLWTCSYSTHPLSSGVGGRSCVGVVLRQCLSTNKPYVLGHVVDHEGDNFTESHVVHSLNIGVLKWSCEVMSCYVPDAP